MPRNPGDIKCLKKQATKILIKERSAIEYSPLISQALSAMILDESVQHRAITMRSTRRLELVCDIGDIKVLDVSQTSHMERGKQQADYPETFNSLTNVFMHLIELIDGIKLKNTITKSQSYSLDQLRFAYT